MFKVNGNYNNTPNLYMEEKGILYFLMSRYKLQLSTEEIETLSSYLAYYNYSYFKEVYAYHKQLLFEIRNTAGEVGYIKYDIESSSVIFVESTVLTDFTNKERTDIVYTQNGKIVIYTFNNFDTAIIFNTESSKRIKIGPYRELEIPPTLEPDDVIDLSANPDDLHKLLHIKIHGDLLKAKEEINSNTFN